MVIAKTQFNGQHYRRSAKPVALNTSEFIAVQAILSGESVGNYNGVEARTKAGDVFLLDLTQVMENKKQPGTRLSFIFPRVALRQLLSHHNIHGTVLPGEAPTTKLLFNYLIGLNNVLENLKGTEAAAAQEAMITLISAAIENADDKLLFSRQVDTPMRQRILDYINANLNNPLLSVESIMQFFRVSRTHLYRAFETEGGVAKAIRDRRLDLAYRLLVNRRNNTLPIDEIKRQCGFPERSQFSKFFYDRFGILPRDLNNMMKGMSQKDEDPLFYHEQLKTYLSSELKITDKI